MSEFEILLAMPLAAFHSFFWGEQPPAPAIVLTAMTKILGPPTLAIMLFGLGYASGAWTF